MEITAGTSSSLTIRPIRPDDRERIQQALEYTSPTTYYRRFHSAKHWYTDRELTYLTEVDGNNHFALIATERDRPERLVAVARFIRNPRDRAEAELAITVHDPYQRQGIGRQMLRLLGEAAREHGVVRLRALVQTDNRAMIALLHRVFPQTTSVARYGSTVEYVAELGSGPASRPGSTSAAGAAAAAEEL